MTHHCSYLSALAAQSTLQRVSRAGALHRLSRAGALHRVARLALLLSAACGPDAQSAASEAAERTAQGVVSGIECTAGGVPCAADSVCVEPHDIDYLDGNGNYKTDCRTRLLQDPNASNRWFNVVGVCKLASQEKRNGCIPHDWNTDDGQASGVQPWGCLLIDEDTHLCPDGEAFPTTVFMPVSHVELNCNGQTLAPQAGAAVSVSDLVEPGTTTHYDAIPSIQTPWAIALDIENSVTDVAIRNCDITQAKVGIRATRAFRDDGDAAVGGAPDACTITPQPASMGGVFLGHSDVTIENVTFRELETQAIGIGAFSQGFSIRDVTISDTTSGPAIYVDAGSTGITIERADIRRTGSREAIAIDSAYGNSVTNSTFVCNGITSTVEHERRMNVGISLYKNAGEVGKQLCPMRRHFGANENYIFGNDFYGDAINVASRTPHEDNIEACDPTTDLYRPLIECAGASSSALRYTDEADRNHVEQNHFYPEEDCQGRPAGMYVAGDDTLVRNNFFFGDTLLRVGRPQSDLPAIKATIEDNKFYASSEGEEPEALVAARDAATVSITNNTASGAACKPFLVCDEFLVADEECGQSPPSQGQCSAIPSMSWSEITAAGLHVAVTPF